MDKNMKFGVVGAGKMAGAILGAIDRAKLFAPEQIVVYDKLSEKTMPLAERGMKVAVDASEVVRECGLILLSAKPQDFSGLLSAIGKETAGKCLLSIAAGISTDYIRERVAKGTYVVRVMPNTPMMLGCGATAIALSPETPASVFELCVRIFAASGQVELMEERLINPVISVNSTSPAYFYKMADIMAEYAESEGIDRKAAVMLAAKAMEGSAKMLLAGEFTPEELVKMVASPGGTTIAALDSLDADGFDEMLKRAMACCTRRACELAQ